MQKKRSLRDLNDREDAFLDNMFRAEFSDNLVGAYIAAGYSDGPKCLSNARKKLRELQDHFVDRVHQRIGSHIPWALNELMLLAANAKNETVKLRALQDILDRGGYKQPIEIRDSSKDAKEMDAKEIARELKSLLDKARPGLKVVEGGKK